VNALLAGRMGQDCFTGRAAARDGYSSLRINGNLTIVTSAARTALLLAVVTDA